MSISFDKLSIPMFDGTTDVNEFIRTFKIAAAVAEWTEAKQIITIELFLKFKPLRIYKTTCPANHTVTTIETVFKALREGCARSASYVHGLFRNRRKKSDETYGQFAGDLYALLKEAMPDTGDDALEGALKAQFCDGIPETMRALVHFDKAKKWYDLVDSLDNIYPTVSCFGIATESKLIDQFKGEPVEHNYMGGKAKPNDSRNSQARFNGNCHFCHNYGHRIADCSKLAQQNGSLNMSNTLNNSYSSFRGNNQSFSNQNQSNPSNQSSDSRQRVNPQNYFQNYNRNTNTNNSTFQRTRSPNSYVRANQNSTNNNRANSRQPSHSTNMNTVASNLDLGAPVSNSTFIDHNASEYDSDVLQHSHNNFIMVDSAKQSFSEFPYLDSSVYMESNALESVEMKEDPYEEASVNSLALSSYENSLLTILTLVLFPSYGNCDIITINALLDCGSNFSFLNRSSLSYDLLAELEADVSCHLICAISSPVGTSYEHCYRVNAALELKEFHCDYELIVAPLHTSHNLIIGQNFLKDKKAIVDFYTAKLIIEDHFIQMEITPQFSTGIHINVIEGVVEKANYRLPIARQLLKTAAKLSGSIGQVNFTNTATALIDCGSTHSFVSPKLISNDFLEMLKRDKTNYVTFEITSATGVVRETCLVFVFKLSLGNWIGSCKFVISYKAAKHDMVLGIDFLRREKVKIDHGSDRIDIGEINILVFASALEPIKTVRFNEHNNHIVDNFGNNVYSSGNTTVKASSKMLIPVICNSECISTSIMYFEPIRNVLEGCLIGKSMHEKSNNIFIDVMNFGDIEVYISDNMVLGKISSCVYAEETADITYGSLPKTIENFQTQFQAGKIAYKVFAISNVTIDVGAITVVEGTSDIVSKSDDLIFFESVVDVTFVCKSELIDRTNTISIKVFNKSSFPVDLVKGTLLGHVSICALEDAFQNKVDNSYFKTQVSTIEAIRRVDEVIAKIKLGPNLIDKQQSELITILVEFYDLFTWNDGPPGCTPFAIHSIPTGNTSPIIQKQYPIPTVAQEPLRQQVMEMLANRIIRPASGPWRSPVLLIAKTDPSTNAVSYRFCIDLRKVNQATTKDAYSLPRIDESIDVLAGAKFFSSVDINRAFWQVPLAEEDKEKTGFMVEGRLYEFNVMPFGSMNAPATFQRLMDRVLSGMTWRQVLVYLDDVLLFSRTWDEHIKSIREVLNRLKIANLKLKPSKCVFGTNTVTYLGFTITDQGIKPAFSKVQALLKTERPTTTKLLLSFLCSVNYYRHDIPCFGEISADLYDMANVKNKFCTWTENAIKNFELLKKALSKAPILAFPIFTMTFYFQTDASIKAMGGVCLQQHSIWRPVMFFGRKLSKVERRYSTTERELLSIVYAYKIAYHLVYGRKIVFQTDHQPLVTLMQLKEPFGRLGRLLHYLVDVDYEIRYIPGNQNFLADFMSRAISEDCDDSPCTATRIEVNSLQITSAIDWPLEQSRDVELSHLRSLIVSNKTDDAWVKLLINGARWLKEKRQLFIFNNVLKHGANQILVPNHLKKMVMEWHHDVPFAAHRGAETVLLAIRIRFFWLNMYSDVFDHCKSCHPCQMFNYSQNRNIAPLKPIVVSRSGQTIGLDYVGPFKASKSGNRYAIIAIDAHDKYVMGAATKSCDALTTAVFVLNEVICKHGMVEMILSDQAKNFEADLFKHLCVLIGAHKIRSSPYHSMGNGITERVNRVIKPAIAKFVDDQGDDWDIYLPMVINAYNTSLHSTIGVTPFEAHFGRPAATVADVILGNKLPASVDPRRLHEFTLQTYESAERIRNQVSLNKQIAQEKYKSQYDKSIGYHPERFRVNDLVKITNFTVRSNHSKAWEPKFLGPFRILRVFSIDREDINYELFDGRNSRVVHYNRLERYFQRPGVEVVLGSFPTFVNNDFKLANVPSLNPLGFTFSTIFAKKIQAKRSPVAMGLLQDSNSNNIQNLCSIETNDRALDTVVIVHEPNVETNSHLSNIDALNIVLPNIAIALVGRQSASAETSVQETFDHEEFNTEKPVYNSRRESSISSIEDFSDNNVDLDQLAILQAQTINNNDSDNQNETILTSSIANTEIAPSVRITRSTSGVVGRPSSTPAVAARKEKEKFLCPGCHVWFTGLKIHQNSCVQWKNLQIQQSNASRTDDSSFQSANDTNP
jgi:hypothetical protein